MREREREKSKKDINIQKIKDLDIKYYNQDQKKIIIDILNNSNEYNTDEWYEFLKHKISIGFNFDLTFEVAEGRIITLLPTDKNINIPLEQKASYRENKLLIGDNYDALKALSLVYKNKIDVIYIDPPYNTERSTTEGNGDNKSYKQGKNKRLIYKNKYGRTGWLNLLYQRLLIAKNLMTDDGIIFVAIDDAEQAYLKIIMDEIFKEENFIGCLPVKTQSGREVNGIWREHEYILIYKRNFNAEIELIQEKNDPKPQDLLRKSGENYLAIDRPQRFFPILEKNGELFMIEESHYKKIYTNLKDEKGIPIFNEEFIKELPNIYKDFNLIWPISIKNTNGKNIEERDIWQRKFTRVKEEIENNKNYESIISKRKLFPLDEDLINEAKKLESNRIYYDEPKKKIMSYDNTMPLKSMLVDTKFNNPIYGTSLLNSILGRKVFDYPKSVNGIKHLLKSIQNKNAIVLDFFAGSGSTAQAVFELNREDNGNRKVILCTNNENNIAIDVTYERLYTIINGKSTNNQVSEWAKTNKPFKNEEFRVIEIDTSKKIDFEGNNQDEIIKNAIDGIKLLDYHFDKNLSVEQVYYELSALNPLDVINDEEKGN